LVFIQIAARKRGGVDSVKNFPHQINQLQRLIDGVLAFAKLIDSG
jgi:hypothetical protein